MGTLVTIEVVAENRLDDNQSAERVAAAMERAFGWFLEIEERCTRFNPLSELMQLCSQAGKEVLVSAILFEAIRFACLLAEESGGAFDPTVGGRMEELGFNREFRTGEIVHNAKSPDDAASFTDIVLDPVAHTVLLRRPLTLDLGAVAKGLAIDMAAQELAPFRDFAIDAGGDLYLAGSNRQGEPWRAGIRHPRRDGETIARLEVSNQAICTSGDYERRNADGRCHIVDPKDAGGISTVASATVVAPCAMLADGLATAAFVLGPQRGIDILNRLEVEGLIITSDLQQYETKGLCRAA